MLGDHWASPECGSEPGKALLIFLVGGVEWGEWVVCLTVCCQAKKKKKKGRVLIGTQLGCRQARGLTVSRPSLTMESLDKEEV